MENKMSSTPWIYGAIAGGALIVFILLQYLGGVSWFMSPVTFLQYVILLVVAVLCGLKERSLNGGYITFGHALKAVFLYFVVCGLLTTLFTYVLFNIVDVPFRQALSQEAAVAAEKMMEKFKAPQEVIDKAVSDTLSGKNYQFKSLLLSYALGLILWFLVSLIIAAIIKRNRPPFDNFTNQPNQ